MVLCGSGGFGRREHTRPVLVRWSMPSGSTWVTSASLYSLPLTVLKSSASASDGDKTAKIANAICQHSRRAFFTVCFFFLLTLSLGPECTLFGLCCASFV